VIDDKNSLFRTTGGERAKECCVCRFLTTVETIQ